MESIIAALSSWFAAIDYTPLKDIIDLNDVRSLAAIAGALIAIRAALRRFGHEAIYRATISHSLNRVGHISNLTVANLKDRPLVVFEVVVRFKSPNTYISLQKFDPPLVIKNLEATSIVPDPYSDISISPNPFDGLRLDMEILLVTERNVVKCKQAKNPASLIAKHLKGIPFATVSRNMINNKIYSREARYALFWQRDGAAMTSFILASGFICDEWPFRYNAIDKNALATDETVDQAIAALSKKIGVHLQYSKIHSF
ncbi:hypothetical protein [Stutzerimonas xanthomarina]|uniref:hypothetical protein n=1 Tax=Stutzerimonas xanthomarina TaxID=271420 RepID=UPI00190E51CA|nr:hypothetical protein [Stutzerimonas xanthomarina]MBK3848103.1 hypothetical protein [Stutzerimonas xanthomarina]